eukprot:scaffold1466_cov56-Phaeocystis_antarctica.AAC.1
MGGGLQGYLFGVLGREACAAQSAVGGCDGDGAPRREARGLGAVSRDFQHLHGPGGGWRTQALCRLEGCCHSDEDCARWDGRDGWRGAEQVEVEAAFCEGGDAGGEPVAVETVPGLLAWGGLYFDTLLFISPVRVPGAQDCSSCEVRVACAVRI